MSRLEIRIGVLNQSFAAEIDMSFALILNSLSVKSITHFSSPKNKSLWVLVKKL